MKSSIKGLQEKRSKMVRKNVNIFQNGDYPNPVFCEELSQGVQRKEERFLSIGGNNLVSF